MRRYQKLLAACSCGGITLGWLQAWELLNFSNIWTELVISLLTILLYVLTGQDASELFSQGGMFFA